MKTKNSVLSSCRPVTTARWQRHSSATKLNAPSRAKPEMGDSRPPFSVVLLYQDQGTASLAMHAYQSFASQLSSEFAVTITIWRFDVLGIPILSEMARQELSQARLILVSAHSHFRLPEELRPGLETLLPARPESDCALVALVAGADDNRPPANPWHDYLQDLANVRGLTFLSKICAVQPRPANRLGTTAEVTAPGFQTNYR